MGLGGAFAAAYLAPDWLAMTFAKDESWTLPVRPLFYSGTLAAALIAGIARHAYTWQEALVYGPEMGAAGAFVVISGFCITVGASRSIAAWADDHGWLPAKVPPPELTLPRMSPSCPPNSVVSELSEGQWLRTGMHRTKSHTRLKASLRSHSSWQRRPTRGRLRPLQAARGWSEHAHVDSSVAEVPVGSCGQHRQHNQVH